MTHQPHGGTADPVPEIAAVDEPMSEAAFAAMYDGRIFLDTVYETRRGAIVNFLVSHRKVAVGFWHSDEDIEQLWQTFKADTEVVSVTVKAARPRAEAPAPAGEEGTPVVWCKRCGGSGFSGRGTGYDDVCDDCGGTKVEAPLTLYAAQEMVISAARCIKHWHDTYNGGMVVSGEHVRALWRALNDYDAATTAAPPSPSPDAQRAEAPAQAVAGEDPPRKWLVNALRHMAREGADGREPLITSPEQHVCWIAADLLDPASTDAVRAALKAEIDRLKPHYQSCTATDYGRMQILEHFEKRFCAALGAATPGDGSEVG